MAFHAFGLGPSCSHIRDIPPTPSSHNDRDKIQLAREMKAKENNSSFVAFVTVASLHEDTLCLPLEFTSSNGFTRKCGKIILTDGEEKSWAFDLRCNRSSESFYIPQGWRNFCAENGRKVGDFFWFKLVKIGEIPFLSFCPKESTNDAKQTQRDKNQKRYCVDPERKKNRFIRRRDSTAPSQNRFMTLDVGKDSLTIGRQYVSVPFMRRNGMDKPGMITILGKDGTKWMVRLREEKLGRLCLGKGWKEFGKANGLKMGDTFTLELVSKNGISMLSLYSVESTAYSRFLEEERRKSLIQNRFVTLTLAQEDAKALRLTLPRQFLKANGIKKLGKITLLGGNMTKWFGYLLSKDGHMGLENGWEGFCEVNGVKIGEFFTLEFIDKQKNKTPVFKFRAQVFL